MKRIDKLTDEQIAAMPAHVDKWVKWGLDCTPADRELVEDGIRRCYELSGLTWHNKIIWVDSPLVGAYTVPHLYNSDDVRPETLLALPTTADQERRQQVRDQWWRHIAGQWLAAWFAYITFFRDVCELEESVPGTWDRLDAYQAANSAGWWWPHTDFCVVSDRPEFVHGEQVAESGWGSHRLHAEDGPAIRWRDGNGLYAWHGVRVPKDLIEEGWSTDRILQEANAEVRRAAIERLGWDQFIEDAELKLVDGPVTDPGNPGNTITLYDVPAAIYDEPVRVLLCTNGTPERDGTVRRFGLTVPADVETAVGAAGWGYGVSADVYAQLARRT